MRRFGELKSFIAVAMLIVALPIGMALAEDSSNPSSPAVASEDASAQPHSTDDSKHGCREAGKLVSRGIQRSDGSREEEDLYRKASEICEQMAEAHHNLGVVLEKQGKFDEAVEAFKKALVVREDPAFRLALASTLLRKEALDEAEREYQRVLDESPRSVMALQGIAVVKEKKGDLQGALDVLVKARSYEETNSLTLFNLGALYQKTGQLEAALDAFEKAAYANPKNYEAQLFAGYLSIQKEDYRKGELYLKKAIDLDRSEAAPHRALAHSYEMQGDFAKAEVSYRRALELKKGDSQALMGLARVHLEMGQPALARSDAEGIIQADANDFRGYGLRGWALFELGDYREAASSFKKAVESNPSSGISFYSLGLAQQRLGEDKEAEQSLETAEKLSPRIKEVGSEHGWRLF